MATWFEELMGFPEESPEQVRSMIELHAPYLVSRANGVRLRYGQLDVLRLDELRELAARHFCPGELSVTEIVADVQQLHCESENAGALFQVASQFNLLEMAAPDRTPEDGVGIYQWDRTQGPACAIAAGAGTIFRNYFALVEGKPGQTRERQIDCLTDLQRMLQCEESPAWPMRNGYALLSAECLANISQRLKASDDSELDAMRSQLRIGVQWETQVTLPGMLATEHCLSQAYCSAVPVAYSHLPPSAWQPFAMLVLEAAYEATFQAALVNAAQYGNNKVFLTKLGGGAFGNAPDWIVSAVRRACLQFAKADLDVYLVSHSRRDPHWHQLLSEFGS